MGRKPLIKEPLYHSPGPSYERHGRLGSCPPSRSRDERRSRPSDTRKGDTAPIEEVAPEDILSQDPGYDADVEVVRPYAIEEPDDDAEQTPTSTSTRPNTPRLLDSAEYWQTELVNSLRDLYCDSDSNDSHPLARQKRGRKRKTATASSPYQNPHLTAPEMRLQDVDLRPDGSFASPKRMRRRSRRSGEDFATVHSALSTADSELGSSRLSPEASGIEPGRYPTNSIPAGDQMDIDPT
ncbi:hypothetical protein VTN77DRAFT_2061 [Rasamsonia byssochlamydoides]|uniref:uncharacterized protein n=1 Tax=Rasamsonia byssochlamydoides TaxID=89139 RepID=UPI003742911D